MVCSGKSSPSACLAPVCYWTEGACVPSACRPLFQTAAVRSAQFKVFALFLSALLACAVPVTLCMHHRGPLDLRTIAMWYVVLGITTCDMAVVASAIVLDETQHITPYQIQCMNGSI